MEYNWIVLLEKEGVAHCSPINDTEEHLIQTEEILGAVICDCKCKPIIEISIDGESAVVIHSSFDGREGVEWANEILGQ